MVDQASIGVVRIVVASAKIDDAAVGKESGVNRESIDRPT
jgi:hypothetical protein